MKPSFSSPVIRYALILFLLWVPARAVAAKTVIDVTTLDQAGKPMAGVKVQIEEVFSKKAKDKKSDAKGVARFDGVDDGAYRVIARADGCSPALYEYVVAKGDSQESVTLKLEPGPADKKLYYEDPALAKQAQEAFAQGVQSLQAQKFADAENQIRVSLQMNPTNPDAHLNLAIAMIQEGKWDPAQEELTKASKISAAMAEIQKTRNPEAATALEQLHERCQQLLEKLPALRLRMAASGDLAKKDFEGAIAKYREIIKAFPEDSDTYYNLALAQANAQKYDDANVSIDQALKLRPTEADYLKLKQQIADHKENSLLKQARAILESADKLAQAGSYAEALQKYEEARPMLSEKNQAVVFAAMGAVHAKMNQNTEAAADYKRAVEIAPDNANYRKMLAQFYVNQKQYDEALNLYSQSKDSSVPADQALVNLAKQMSQQGNNEVAELAYQKALEANPQNAEACYELGMSYFYSKKNTDKAKELLTKYLEIGKDQGKIDNVKNVLIVIEKRKP